MAAALLTERGQLIIIIRGQLIPILIRGFVQACLGCVIRQELGVCWGLVPAWGGGSRE